MTGGASGIGRAAALAFAREGARVVVSDVTVVGGEETVQMIQATGGTAMFVKADVSQGNEVERMVKLAVETYGRLDCAFNNAGIQGDLAQTAECSEENWQRIIAINLTGVWLCMKHAIPFMVQRGSGAIVNTASNFGLVGSNGMPAYAASKHGVLGLTKTAALEYAKAGIRINAVCPGPTQTPLVDNVLRQQPQRAEPNSRSNSSQGARGADGAARRDCRSRGVALFGGRFFCDWHRPGRGRRLCGAIGNRAKEEL